MGLIFTVRQSLAKLGPLENFPLYDIIVFKFIVHSTHGWPRKRASRMA